MGQMESLPNFGEEKIQTSLRDSACWRKQKQEEDNAAKSGETSQSTKSEAELSSATADALRAKVRKIVQKKFSEARATLWSSPTATTHEGKSDAVVFSEPIIDLVTRSDVPSQQEKPIDIAGSDVSVASTPS